MLIDTTTDATFARNELYRWADDNDTDRVVFEDGFTRDADYVAVYNAACARAESGTLEGLGAGRMLALLADHFGFEVYDDEDRDEPEWFEDYESSREHRFGPWEEIDA